MFDPFDLSIDEAYRDWKTQKLRAYPADVSRLRVCVDRLDRPTDEELTAIRQRIGLYNMALVEVDPAQIAKQSVLTFGRALGLERTDANLFADEAAVSSIQESARPDGDRSGDQAGGAGARADYIPYTNQPLSWHTDGYYNSLDAQVGAWCLFCVRPASSGGENGLLDHEVVYIRLRDESPEHILALSHPEAMTIPANVVEGQTLRPESIGPVFSIRAGRLHMRYTARSRNVSWRDSPDTRAARQALDRLFSQSDVFTFRYRLEAGEAMISNNVIHCRSGFEDDQAASGKRLLYRVRYLDHIETHPAEA
jgi:alpha-ketoglutarate-dependent taurine dioxygenase